MDDLKPKFLLGRKLGMTQIFIDDKTIPTTVLEILPGEVLKLKTSERDGYSAVVLKFGKRVKEFRIPEECLKYFNEGDKLDISLFKKGELVNIRGKRKGKGFAGVVKRHGFHGGPRTHGQKNKERSPGSIGQRWPQRVRKGLKMAGRIAPIYVTVRNLEIVEVIPEKNLLLVKGSIPGPNKSLVELRSSYITNKGKLFLTSKVKKSLTKV